MWSLGCAAIILAVCLIVPRGFCGYICPLGTLIDLFDGSIGQHINRQHALAVAFVVGDDLQQVLPGQIVARFKVDDLHLAPFADECRDIVERHVITGFGIVETPAGVALDQQWSAGICHQGPLPLWRCSISLLRCGTE